MFLDAYLRPDIVVFKNTVDLDSSQSDDTSAYLGIDYSIALHNDPESAGARWLVKLERNGPWDYDAPLFVHNALLTSGGRIEAYRNDELLPALEEFWLDWPLAGGLRVQAGLFAYEVGLGFSLNGSYENYGVLLSQERKGLVWRFYYCRPDLVYKNRLGPRVRQEEEQGQTYEHNAANFCAFDLRVERESWWLHPYIGALVDYTSADKRANLFSTPVDHDILGTVGYALGMRMGEWEPRFEIARNFGWARSADSGYEDIEHKGYLVYAELRRSAGAFHPIAQCLVASGNTVTFEDAQNGAQGITGGTNRAFGYSSPFNDNLSDSISGVNTDIRTLVASGCGWGLQYGVRRPSTFSASDFDNIIIPAIGFDADITEKLNISVYGFYLRAFEKAVGMLDGVARRLSADLGQEVDVYADYRLNEHVTFSFLVGYFFPGHYYREKRDDADGNVLSPFIRGDGDADGAYQAEAAVELRF